MSTIAQLIDGKILHQYRAGVKVYDRHVYGLQPFVDFVRGDLQGLSSSWTVQETPAEQIAAFLADFCEGEVLEIRPHLKSLMHLGSGIWELKTADVRVFGWFPLKDVFIADDGGHAGDIKVNKLYPTYCSNAVGRRSQGLLAGLPFITGSDPNNVVSNHSFP